MLYKIYMIYIVSFLSLAAMHQDAALPDGSSASQNTSLTTSNNIFQSSAALARKTMQAVRNRQKPLADEPPLHSLPDNSTESIPVTTPAYTDEQLNEMRERNNRNHQEYLQIKARDEEQRKQQKRNPERDAVLTPDAKEHISTLMKEMAYNSAKKYAFAIGSTILGVITLKAILDWYFKTPSKNDRPSRFFANSTTH